jgi:ADP-ribose pyrophosphatase YjhB (NUDIX family)
MSDTDTNTSTRSETDSDSTDPFQIICESTSSADSDTDDDGDITDQVEVLADIADINKKKPNRAKPVPSRAKAVASKAVTSKATMPKAVTSSDVTSNDVTSNDIKPNDTPSSITKSNRKVFYYRGSYPVMATGVVLYRYVETKKPNTKRIRKTKSLSSQQIKEREQAALTQSANTDDTHDTHDNTDKTEKMEILLIYKDNKYEDIGGKIDLTDDSIESAAAREVEEETNSVISSESIIERLNAAMSQPNRTIYVPNAKYLIFVVECTDDERVLKKDVFGEYEAHDKIKRSIGWISKDEIFSQRYIAGKKLNERIKNKNLSDALTKIERIHKNPSRTITKSLFK